MCKSTWALIPVVRVPSANLAKPIAIHLVDPFCLNWHQGSLGECHPYLLFRIFYGWVTPHEPIFKQLTYHNHIMMNNVTIYIIGHKRSYDSIWCVIKLIRWVTNDLTKFYSQSLLYYYQSNCSSFGGHMSRCLLQFDFIELGLWSLLVFISTNRI